MDQIELEHIKIDQIELKQIKMDQIELKPIKMDQIELKPIKSKFEMPNIVKNPFEYTLFSLILYEDRCNCIKDEIKNYFNSDSIAQNTLQNPILLAINLQQNWLIEDLINLIVDKEKIKNFREYIEQNRLKNDEMLIKSKKLHVSIILNLRKQSTRHNKKEENKVKEGIRTTLRKKATSLYNQIDNLDEHLNSNYESFESSELTRLFTISNNLKYNLNSLIQLISTLDIQI